MTQRTCRSLLLLSLPLVLIAGCGPTDEEVARVVLGCAPVALAVGLGLLRLLRWPWRKLDPALELRWKPGLVALAVLGGLAILALFGLESDGPGQLTLTLEGVDALAEWGGVSLVFFGTSFLAVHLLTWRLLLASRWRAHAFTWAFGPPVLLLVTPALPLLFELVPDNLNEVLLSVWIYTGYGGLVPGILFGLAWLELLGRWLWRRKAAGDGGNH